MILKLNGACYPKQNQEIGHCNGDKCFLIDRNQIRNIIYTNLVHLIVYSILRIVYVHVLLKSYLKKSDYFIFQVPK
jgi:hypothetical protein